VLLRQTLVSRNALAVCLLVSCCRLFGQAAATGASSADAPVIPAAADTITVTATRTTTRIADTPASVVVLSGETLETTAAPTLDDALRQIPGFTLFRRTGSRVANPTTQGVSLRGVGASGASRALVLDDGIPLNDPFGSWVSWGRVPVVAVERAEVLRGGASELYGSAAMGGVVQLVRRTSPGVAIDATGGTAGTGSAAAYAGFGAGNVALELFRTDGYILVRPEDRGAVDEEAGSRHASVDATLRSAAGAFLRGSYYDESRENGTPLQVNDTTTRQLAGGFSRGALLVRANVLDEQYFQTFSAIAADRNSERPTSEQRIETKAGGASGQYSLTVGKRHVLVGGVDATHAQAVGKQQSLAGVWLEDLFAVRDDVAVTAGVRADTWESDGGLRETQVNPRLSLLWKNFSIASYTAFRAPTLNELYRGFRVGNVNTLPNAALRPETLTGFEAGVRARGGRLTLFYATVEDTVANVTIASTPALITRQRQNLGSTRSMGAEFDYDWSAGRDWRGSFGLLFTDAAVREGDLRGKRVPQVPRQQGTAQVSWRWISAQLRWSGMQFDDDRNELPLRAFFVADVFASHPLGRGFEATLALENVFDEEVEAGATPVVTLGQPRAARVGLRYRR
jgi:outer membrane receptor protein involved in Fe transport